MPWTCFWKVLAYGKMRGIPGVSIVHTESSNLLLSTERPVFGQLISCDGQVRCTIDELADIGLNAVRMIGKAISDRKKDVIRFAAPRFLFQIRASARAQALIKSKEFLVFLLDFSETW